MKENDKRKFAKDIEHKYQVKFSLYGRYIKPYEKVMNNEQKLCITLTANNYLELNNAKTYIMNQLNYMIHQPSKQKGYNPL